MRNIFTSYVAFIFIMVFTSCGDTISEEDYGIFSFQDDQTVIMDGLIDSDIATYWNNYISDHPNTVRMIMNDCPGSTDDDANWEAAKSIYANQIDIHLTSTSVIASGAVDLFMAGNVKTREAGSKLGVHAWSDGNGTEATEYPEGHIEHQDAIAYYQDIGYSLKEAESFYYFTINAAAAADIHWMTDSEIELYKVLD